MCRNIRVLHHFEPPTTKDEMAAAALQYVRKVSGAPKPSAADRDAFDVAVGEVTAATQKLLAVLHAKGAPRTRDGEKLKAVAKWAARAERIARG
ncbi:DUF2277 domain-containing protein [soil metagenome]